MAGLEWNTLNRLNGLGLMGGMGQMVGGMGALGKGTHAMLQAQADQADKAQLDIQRDLPKLDALLGQVQNTYGQVQQAVQNAQDLASQTTSQTALTMLDRIGKTVGQIEDQVAAAEAIYEKAGTLPTVRFKGGVEGTPDGAAQWIQAGQNVTAAAAGLRAAQQQVSRLSAQVAGVLKQIQQQVSREAQVENDRLRREQAAADAITRREQAAQAAEDRKIQAEYDREQARANAEIQRENQQRAQEAQRANLEAQQTAALYAPAPELAPPPAGYQYAYPAATPGGGGPAYQAAAVSYAEQPQQWQSQQPQQFMQPQGYQVPAPAPTSLYPGWTSVEYGALMEGESAFLRGLRGLGAASSYEGVSHPTTDPYVLAKLRVAQEALRTGAATQFNTDGATQYRVATPTGAKTLWSPAADISAILTAAGWAAAAALPAFGVTPQPAAPVAQASSGVSLGTVVTYGALGLGLVWAASKLLKPASAKRRKR